MDSAIFDFKATLVFKTSEEGGRNTPVFSGYRPHIEFDNYPEYLTLDNRESSLWSDSRYQDPLCVSKIKINEV